jgi:hypothetical protein
MSANSSNNKRRTPLQTSHKLIALGAAILLAGCQSVGKAPEIDSSPSPANPNFAGEKAKFDAQFPNPKIEKYEADSIAFNNQNKLDEKGDCHNKHRNPITIILLLDANGKVTSSLTDVENAKAACFRNAYASVQFPKPPIAPYRKAMLLR